MKLLHFNARLADPRSAAGPPQAAAEPLKLLLEDDTAARPVGCSALLGRTPALQATPVDEPWNLGRVLVIGGAELLA